MVAKRKVNFVNIATIIFLVALLIASYVSWDSLKIVIRNFLELNGLDVISFGVPFIIFLISFFSNSESSINHTFIGSSFGRFFDTVINGLTYGAAISSSLTLIKGFYIQKLFDDKQFFLEFSNVDIWLLFLTMCFLLYFCLSRVIDVVKELIWTTESVNIEK